MVDEATPKALDYATLSSAWWKWVDDNCPSQSPRARGKWMHANTFTYDGTTWKMQSMGYKSNSGKTTRYETVFVGEDGRRVESMPVPKNRRNDPERNWGLPE